jgi:2'-5' RNA ligase
VKRRLFVASALDHDVRAACAAVAARLEAKGFAGRFVPSTNYHLTVAFLGSVEEERIAEITAALREVAPRLAPFELALERIGAFPDPRRPRVAWVGPALPAAAFGTLCGVVRSALVAHGFTFDPHADAHVTIARGDGRTPLPHVKSPRIVPVRVDALTLYESHTDRSGARYEPLDVIPFAASP